MLASLAWSAPGVSSVEASLVLKVSQPDPVEDALVDLVDGMGGWFQVRTPGSLTLRVPSDRVDELMAQAAKMGVVADRRLAATDLTTEIADQRSRLEAREASLDLYHQLLRTANPKSVVAIERQVTALVEEIEALSGRIRFLEHQGAWAKVQVDFQLRDRRPPVRDGSSSFAWLNTVNLEDLVVDLASPDDWGSAIPADPAVPAGFSAYRGGRSLRAVTPDGVLYRVRVTDKIPRAELSFWRDALRSRMEAAGYQLASQQPVRSGDVDGAEIELRAPLGGQDWAYLVAIFPVGDRLVLAESAGEVTALETRKPALAQAMGDLSLRR
jgi:hypothetical protein